MKFVSYYMYLLNAGKRNWLTVSYVKVVNYFKHCLGHLFHHISQPVVLKSLILFSLSIFSTLNNQWNKYLHINIHNGCFSVEAIHDNFTTVIHFQYCLGYLIITCSKLACAYLVYSVLVQVVFFFWSWSNKRIDSWYTRRKF